MRKESHLGFGWKLLYKNEKVTVGSMKIQLEKKILFLLLWSLMKLI